MKKLIALLLLWYPSFTFCQTGNDYFQQKVDYKIEVELNDLENTLDGFEVINYTNNSPDTLTYIWFHLWPNAFKNDRTAFSEQLLQLGRTDFYFSDDEQRGYINRLDFKVNNISANLKDHPLYIDVAQLILPQPLAPGKSVLITTPFHVKIPFNFSRGGQVDQTYQITQWYPKPAVYDRKGWHEMPYLDQGEFFSEFGDYDVKITLPERYIIAATGELDNESGTEPSTGETNNKNSINEGLDVKSNAASGTPHSKGGKLKTYLFSQKDVHDFAWFANKKFIVKKDTLQLPSGRTIKVAAYYTSEGKQVWKNSISYLKNSILTRSKWLGEYPYNTVTAVEAKMGFTGGMEYPTITSISPLPDEKSLEMTIEHEVGHNWNYGILATNERDFPWMDEGINTYYDAMYADLQFGQNQNEEIKGFLNKRLPKDPSQFGYRNLIEQKKDQPVNTKSIDFSADNYGLIAYYKSSLWMKKLETFLGKPAMENAMQEYYKHWKFKHPYPEDFKKIIEDASGKNIDTLYSLLNKKGYIDTPAKKSIKPAFLFNLRETNKYNYLSFSPAVGANFYDKIMLGLLVHNYSLPEPDFHFLIAPMYGTGSNRFTGLARIGYNIMSYGIIRKTEISLSGSAFSMDEFTDSTGKKNYMGFSKIVPSVKLIFKNKYATSEVTKYVQWKTYFIQEASLLFPGLDPKITVITYPKTSRYLNQLILSLENNRVLYPYSAKLATDQSNGFIRFAFDGNYYFNYAKGGGMSARIFAGKFAYLGDKTNSKQFSLRRYQLNMSGANGEEDYTYSNYFAGRNEFDNFSSQQMMIKDGGFKVHTDFLYNKIGKTDDWLTAINLKTDFPKKLNPLQVLPFKVPLKVFLDIGTYADAWKKDAVTGKFIYDAGLQISLWKEIVNVYIPLLYSKVYKNYYQSIPEGNTFLKKISFSIDIQKFKLNSILDIPGL